MSSGKIKARRHSLPSLGGGSSPPQQQSASGLVQEDQHQQMLVASPDSSAKAARKRALDHPEMTSEAKRPAVSIDSSLDGGQLQERVSKEQLQVSEHTLCCLPGGVCVCQ